MYIIDTCSLLALVRYHLPLDDYSHVYEFIKEQFLSQRLIVIEEVLEQCGRVSGGIVTKRLDYLVDKQHKHLIIKTKDLLPPSPQRFSRQIDNNFVRVAAKNLLTSDEYNIQKEAFTKDADIRMIVYALRLRNGSHTGQGKLFNGNSNLPCIITEETEADNDNKLFKKIPAICRELEINWMNISEYFTESNDFTIHQKSKRESILNLST